MSPIAYKEKFSFFFFGFIIPSLQKSMINENRSWTSTSTHLFIYIHTSIIYSKRQQCLGRFLAKIIVNNLQFSFCSVVVCFGLIGFELEMFGWFMVSFSISAACVLIVITTELYWLKLHFTNCGRFDFFYLSVYLLTIVVTISVDNFLKKKYFLFFNLFHINSIIFTLSISFDYLKYRIKNKTGDWDYWMNISINTNKQTTKFISIFFQ